MSSGTTNRYRVPIWRALVVYGLMSVFIGAIIYRLINLQIATTDTWTNQATDNYTLTTSDPAPRGIIFDRNGYVLARNVASYNVVITPADLPDDDADIQRIYRELSDLTGVAAGGPVTEETLDFAKLFSACVPGPTIADMVALGASLAPYTPVKITCNISEDLARVIGEKSVDWPGVSIEIEPVRDYPTGSLTANVIGFLGPIPAALQDVYEARGFVTNRDKIGYAGVEASLDDILIGKNGLRVVQRDVAGAVLRNLEPPIPATPGKNVVLTIDTRLQKAAEAVLVDEINSWNAYYGTIRISSGVVIAMNPKTGEILAMVTYPTFENNRMARFIPGYYYNQLSEDPRHPLVNNAISAELAPGSTFKLSTATGAFNEGVIRPGMIVQTPGKLELCQRFSPNDPCNPRPFVDWIYERNGVINEAGFGSLDFYHCIAYSSNVCFYKLGGGFENEIPEGLGIFRLGEYARALGYGERSGIELPGEENGLIPTPQWKRINTGENWSTGDTFIASVGQGYVLGTPLQVLMSGATIANRGKLMQPTIVREIQDDEGRVIPAWFNPSLDDFSVYEVQEVENIDGSVQRVWVNPAKPNELLTSPPEGSYQISPFTANMKWDITTDPLIHEWTCEAGYCDTVPGVMKTVTPETVEAVRTGTRLAVTEQPLGTLYRIFNELYPLDVAVAGKTGTAEYCDDVASKANRCQFGAWPTHAWTLAYAPYDDPEIIVIAFAYNGGEGGTVAAPIVARVLQAYFELKSIDIAQSGGG